MRRRISTGRLLIGTVCGWLLVVLCVWKVTRPSFDTMHRQVITGRVTDVRTPLVMKQPVLDFALDGQSLRFRVSSGLFQEALAKQVPPAFRAGASARLEVQELWLRDPFRMAPDRVLTAEVAAISVDGQDVLPLAATRKWEASEGRGWWYFLPVTIACSLFLSAFLVRRLFTRR